MGIPTRLLLGICLIQLVLLADHLTHAQSRCNFTLTVRHNEKAVLKNPFYVNNIDSCWFVYKVDRPGYGLRIDFTSFDLEEKTCIDALTNKTTCCDYLQIRPIENSNALVSTAATTTTMCGSTRPDSMLLDSNAVWFNFHTNSEHTFDGFKLELTPYQLTFTEPSGVISSPDLVNHVRYANNMNVTYRIQAPVGQIVSIRFQKLNIENFKDQCVDYLEIGSSSSPTTIHKPRRRFCGDDQFERQFLVESNSVYLRFVTDDSVTASGFELFYKMIQTEFTASTGSVQLVEYPLDIVYSIRAPDGFKIELDVREFNFAECQADDVNKLVSAPHQVCTDDNDHIRFSNQIGSLPSQIFQHINESISETVDGVTTGSKWVFCACNKPAKTYTSLSNELKLEYIHGKATNTTTSASLSHRVQKNWFKIDYKFVPMQFVATERLRLVQDGVETSLIGGYHLRVRVPAKHHLRLYGKSARCSFPARSVLSKWISPPAVAALNSNVTNATVVNNKMIVTRVLDLNVDEFKKNCSYLLDVSEPTTSTTSSSDLFAERSNDDAAASWELSWFLKFDSPFDLYDFELNWKFIKNTLVDETKPSKISLPKEIGFDSIDRDLIFVFKSSSSSRKYTLSFDVKERDGLGRNDKVRDFIRLKSSPTSGYEKIADKTELAVDSTAFALKIKRSNALALHIAYKMGTQAGDCNFDQSICNYTSNLLADSALGTSPLVRNANGQVVRHLPRYASISINDREMLRKSKDFYLAIFKMNDNTEAIYSPLIRVQKESRSSLFNKRVHTISFSYQISNHSMDQLEMFLVKNRSETTVKIDSSKKARLVKEMIDKYDHLSWERNKQVQLERSEGMCPSGSNMEMANRFASLARPVAEAGFDLAWYRVEKVKVFSCYDFRLGFALRIDQESGRMRSANAPPAQIGIDDVQINQGEELSECEENVCGANGICYMFENKPTCCCMAGYEGTRCERKLSACQLSTVFDQTTASVSSTICKNGGNCTDLSVAFDYKCDCPPGFTGKNCEVEINECEPNPCLNNARCIDRIGGFDCVCKTGFSGVRCETRDEDCSEKCAAYGTDECIKDKTKPPICVCKPGFTGDNCAIKLKINKCLSSPCVGMSQCVNQDDSVKCICPEDRTGKFCEIELNFCNEYKDLCQNGSACLFANRDASAFNCSCAAGFKGRFCNETIDDCVSNPCEHGTCIDLDLGFKCECDKGYVGRFCNIKPKDPCYRHKCENGMCTPKIGSWGYNCNCYSEAEGEFCEKKKCDKTLLIGSQCNINGTADVVVSNGKCHCVCKQDFTGAGCESRIDLCELREKTGSLEKECKNGGICSYNNATGRVSCDCPKGFTGDRCEIIENYCRGEPCKNGMCRNQNNGSYICECSPGWTGVNCTEQVSVCSLSEDCVAENTISVQHTKHSCVCLCKMGFTGKKCQTNIDDCANVKCENGGTCHDLTGSFRCQCPIGYDGPMCERKVDNCDVNPCKNGNCVMLGTLLKCECDRGYTGKFCDTFIDKCKPNPCQNDAVCHNLIDSYHCECPLEFGTSQNCSDRLIDPCKNSPCFNDGQCSPIAKISDVDKKTLVYTGFTCLCPDSFTGRLCEQPRNPCDSNPCHNRGQCRPAMFNDNDYTCLCYPAYTGKNCESHFDPCKEPKNQCLNGGQCLPTRREGSKCKCPPNFSGEKCEIPVNECDLMNCMNGGECVKQQGIPYCKCPNSRYIGTRCEIDLATFKPKNQTAKMSSTSSRSITCGLLGNDVKPTDMVFFWLMIFALFVLILAIVYTYVYLKIKKTKDSYKNISHEKEALEINDSSERRLP